MDLKKRIEEGEMRTVAFIVCMLFIANVVICGIHQNISGCLGWTLALFYFTMLYWEDLKGREK